MSLQTEIVCWLVEDTNGYQGVTFIDPQAGEGAYDGFKVTPLVRAASPLILEREGGGIADSHSVHSGSSGDGAENLSEPVFHLRSHGDVTLEELERFSAVQVDEPKCDKGTAAIGPPSDAAPSDSARLRMVLDTFGKREDNMPLTQAERNLLAAFADRGAYTDRMKLGAIDDAVRATGVQGTLKESGNA